MWQVVCFLHDLDGFVDRMNGYAETHSRFFRYASENASDLCDFLPDDQIDRENGFLYNEDTELK